MNGEEVPNLLRVVRGESNTAELAAVIAVLFWREAGAETSIGAGPAGRSTSAGHRARWRRPERLRAFEEPGNWRIGCAGHRL